MVTRWTHGKVSLLAGMQTLSLPFSGMQLRDTGMNGAGAPGFALAPSGQVRGQGVPPVYQRLGSKGPKRP